MQNFNTNQTRHFYVAGADKTGSSIENNLDIQVKQTDTGEIYFMYKNADGIITRSDTIPAANIKHLSATAAADMAKPLMAHVITVDTDAITLSGADSKINGSNHSLVGKSIECVVTAHQYLDYDDASARSFVASVVGNSTNLGSASALYNELAKAIFKSQPIVDKNFPLLKVYLVKGSTATEVTKQNVGTATILASATGVVIVEGIQKYVRGKLTGEPCKLSVAFRIADGNSADVAWGKDGDDAYGNLILGTGSGAYTVASTVACVNSKFTVDIAPATLPAIYTLADLEYFALGERGDYYRGAFWPNDYTPTYAISDSDIASKVATYKVLNIEYFWAGDAEHVQKSPRLIQVAAKVTGTASVPVDPVASLLSTIEGFIAGRDSNSGA